MVLPELISIKLIQPPARRSQQSKFKHNISTVFTCNSGTEFNDSYQKPKRTRPRTVCGNEELAKYLRKTGKHDYGLSERNIHEQRGDEMRWCDMT